MANRIKYYEICGKTVALNYSVLAAEDIEDGIDGENKNIVSYLYPDVGAKVMFRNVTRAAEIMMREGAVYERIISGKEFAVFSAKELLSLLGMREMIELQTTCIEAVSESLQRRIEVKDDSNEIKNVMTTRTN